MHARLLSPLAGMVLAGLVAAACTGAHPISHRPPALSTTTARQAASAATSASSLVTVEPNPATRPAHVVVVVLENHSYAAIVGNSQAPFINGVAAGGALFTHSFAVRHPSQPNYLAMFSGSTQNVRDDSCPHTFATPNLGQELMAAGLSFAGYSEDLPSPGYEGCSSGSYARKHNPWVNFSNVPASANLPFTEFPKDYAKLPTVAFVIPNENDDMHDGSIAQADQWLQRNLGSYATWALAHDSLFILTFDEDDDSQKNQIATVIAGAHVVAGTFPERIDHYRLLRTLEDVYRLPHAGASATTEPITSIWSP